MIYNSSNFCVVEFSSVGNRSGSGFEIMDKTAKREIFIDGSLAEHFRQDVVDLIATDPSMEEVDDFLSRFSPLMQQPVMLH